MPHIIWPFSPKRLIFSSLWPLQPPGIFFWNEIEKTIEAGPVVMPHSRG
jgi:hypothetical protein